MAKHSVYVLINDTKPIYVGVTDNIKVRILQHKKTKIFTSYEIIESFEYRYDALTMERGIIKFISLFNHNMQNGLYAEFVLKSELNETISKLSKLI